MPEPKEMPPQDHPTLKQKIKLFFNEIYDALSPENGRPLELRLFDVQVCDDMSFSWLSDAANSVGVSMESLQHFVEAGILQTWSNNKGDQGFLLYAPEQLKTLQELRQTGGYSDPELKHFMEKWAEQIKCTVEVVPYDELGQSDIDIYRKRANREIEDLRSHITWFTGTDLDEAYEHLEAWKRVAERAATYDEHTLSESAKQKISRSLFQQRLVDELIRISDAAKFRFAISQGFSPEIFFSSYTISLDLFEFHTINWEWSIESYRRTRAEGKKFPLRTPDFEITERGLTFYKSQSIEEYSRLYERYQLKELTEIIERLGSGMWIGSPIVGTRCAECSNEFEKTVSTKQYCSEKCRSRARQRRWRESDPERARLAQARYWKGYQPEEF